MWCIQFHQIHWLTSPKCCSCPRATVDLSTQVLMANWENQCSAWRSVQNLWHKPTRDEMILTNHLYPYILHILFMILFVHYSLFPGNSSTVLFFTPNKMPKGDLHHPQPSSPLSPSRAQAFYPWVRGNRPKHIVPWQFEGLAEATLKQEYTRTKDLRLIFFFRKNRFYVVFPKNGS